MGKRVKSLEKAHKALERHAITNIEKALELYWSLDERMADMEKTRAAFEQETIAHVQKLLASFNGLGERLLELEALKGNPTDVKQACHDVIAEATLGVRRDAEDAIKGLRECRQANSDLLARLYAAEQKIIAMEREIRSPQELEKFRLAQVNAGAEY